MANTAFDHSASITVPSSTVNNRVITWNGTTGKNFNNTALVSIAAGVVTGVTALTVDNLTIDGNTITSTDTNGNITLTPNGSGSVVADTVGNSEMSFNGTVLDLKNNGTQSSIKLYCETGNAHYQEIRGGPHSGATSYTMILPHVPPTANQVLTTASISSNVAVLDWADAAGGSITALSGNAENRIPAFGSTTTVLDGDADFTWDGNKLLVGNGTASTKITKGASFDMDGNADTVMEWRSTGRITHGMTGILDTNTFGAVQFVSGANSPNAGGLMLIGVSHANAGDKSGIGLTAVMRSGQGDNSHTLGQSGSPSGALLIQARQVSGTSWAALDAGENMIVVRNHTTTKYILDADGNTYQTGNVVIGTAGKGIDFSATSDEIGAGSMSNELFDDYEEGTFTAILKDSSGNVATQSQNSGRYTKIGNQVFIHIRVQVTSISGMVSGNSARIDGMPFAASSEAELVGGTFCWYASSLNMTNGGKYISANPEPSDTYMHMREWGENQEGVSTALTVGEISADGHILMSGIIRT